MDLNRSWLDHGESSGVGAALAAPCATAICALAHRQPVETPPAPEAA
jgi:hypothetical protein